MKPAHCRVQTQVQKNHRITGWQGHVMQMMAKPSQQGTRGGGLPALRQMASEPFPNTRLPYEPLQGSAPPAPAQACVPVTHVPRSADLPLSVPGPAWGSKESRYRSACDIQDQAALLTRRQRPDGTHTAQAPWAQLCSSMAVPHLRGGRARKMENGLRASGVWLRGPCVLLLPRGANGNQMWPRRAPGVTALTAVTARSCSATRTAPC